MQEPNIGDLVGSWTYRSFINDPDVTTNFNDLEFGRGTITVSAAPMGVFVGRIFGPGWELTLSGAIGYGNPWNVRFQGRGVVGGEEWIYDYIGVVTPPWPNGIAQRPAMTGSVVRTIPHSGGADGKAVAPAGVTASWFAVRQS